MRTSDYCFADGDGNGSLKVINQLEGGARVRELCGQGQRFARRAVYILPAALLLIFIQMKTVR